MNKTEFVRALAEKACLTRQQAENAYDAMLEVVVETLTAGERIQLVGFGTFDLKDKPATEIYNPSLKKKVTAPASSVPTFKFGKAFKQLFNE